MSESISRYAIVEKLTTTKLELMDSKLKLGNEIKSIEQEIKAKSLRKKSGWIMRNRENKKGRRTMMPR